jgi:hypothetical protein
MKQVYKMKIHHHWFILRYYFASRTYNLIQPHTKSSSGQISYTYNYACALP